MLLGDEPWPPYERPPLSKAYLTGAVSPEQLALRPPGYYESLGVDVRLGEEVVELDLERRAVRLAGGGTEAFDLLVLATGGEPRRPAGVDGLVLRRREDADALRQLDEVTIIGAGFIGCEVAASMRALGRPVTVYEAAAVPLARVLGDRLGGWLAEVHRSHGVDLRTSADPSAAFGGTSPPSGEEASLLIAVGTRPRTELAEAAGIDCDDGILVDELGRTSAPGVLAAGDCASFLSPIYERHVRVEHFQTAWRMGEAVGAGRRFTEAPWFWSDQYDLNLQYAGAGVAWDQEVVRGAFGEPPFTVFQLAGGLLVGALGVNDARTISRARRLLEASAAVTPAQLEDPAFDLRKALP